MMKGNSPKKSLDVVKCEMDFNQKVKLGYGLAPRQLGDWQHE